MEIKGITIGSGIPVICVPVIGTRKTEIIRQIQEYVAKGIQMIEWRADWFQDLEREEEVLEILRSVKDMVKDTILLFTIRGIGQGGQGKLSDEKLHSIIRTVAGAKVVDFVDLEYFDLSDGKEFIQELHELGVSVISSQHDFMKTPKSEKMWDMLKKMREGGADIVKLAVMPEEPQDVLDILSVTTRFHSTYPETPVVTMSMGSMGVISRISGELFGSAITFGAMGEGSAPGQLEVDELRGILDKVHIHNI